MIDLDPPDWRSAYEQFPLLADIAVIAFDNHKLVVKAFDDLQLFKYHRERGRFIMQMRNTKKAYSNITPQRRYEVVRQLIDDADFPLRTFIRNHMPYLMYYHGYHLYNKLPNGCPEQAVIEGCVPEGHLPKTVMEDIWDTALDERYFEEDEHVLAEDIEFWEKYQADPLCELVPYLKDRYFEVNFPHEYNLTFKQEKEDDES